MNLESGDSNRMSLGHGTAPITAALGWPDPAAAGRGGEVAGCQHPKHSYCTTLGAWPRAIHPRSEVFSVCLVPSFSVPSPPSSGPSQLPKSILRPQMCPGTS